MGRSILSALLIAALTAGDAASLLAQSQSAPHQVLTADSKLATARETMVPTDPNFREASAVSIHADIKLEIQVGKGNPDDWLITTTSWGAIVYRSPDGKTEYWGQLNKNGSMTVWRRDYDTPQGPVKV